MRLVPIFGRRMKLERGNLSPGALLESFCCRLWCRTGRQHQIEISLGTKDTELVSRFDVDDTKRLEVCNQSVTLWLNDAPLCSSLGLPDKRTWNPVISHFCTAEPGRGELTTFTLEETSCEFVWLEKPHKYLMLIKIFRTLFCLAGYPLVCQIKSPKFEFLHFDEGFRLPPLHLPIKSKFGWAILDNLVLQGWHTTGSTASVSWHLSGGHNSSFSEKGSGGKERNYQQTRILPISKFLSSLLILTRDTHSCESCEWKIGRRKLGSEIASARVRSILDFLWMELTVDPNNGEKIKLP